MHLFVVVGSLKKWEFKQGENVTGKSSSRPEDRPYTSLKKISPSALAICNMVNAKKTRKFGAVKRIISSRDARLKKNQEGDIERKKKEASQSTQVVREIPQVSSSLFFQYNTALVPPYSVLVDVSN